MKNLFKLISRKTSYCLEELFAFITPPDCPSCDLPLADPHLPLCEKCSQDFTFKGGGPVCLLCQAPKSVVCRCQPIIGSDIPDLYFWGEYSEIMKKLIHKFKFEGNKRIGQFLINNALKTLADQLEEFRYDYIIPVPMYQNDRRDRGFNQADLIGLAVAEKLDVPLRLDLLYKSSKTKLQAKLNMKQRWQNISGAFSVNKNSSLIGKTILLVDDIVTTGATCSSASAVLYKAGVQKIDIFAIVCSAPGHHQVADS